MPGEWGSPSDRAISALAIVKASFDRRASFLSYFEPFLEHCMLKEDVDLVSIPDLQRSIKQRFGLSLPQTVIKTLLRRQEELGHVRVTSNTCRIQRAALSGADLEPEHRKAMRQQGALLKSLIQYARRALPSREKGWDRRRAQDLLLEYVQQFSARLLSATMAGGELPAIDPNWERDQHIVHTFVLHAEQEDPDSFEFLTELVKGKMLADAVYLGEAEINDGIEPLAGVEVYLDTPILLRLLGYAGSEMAAPYVELLEILKKQEANIRCFDSNVAEARRILYAAERGARREFAERARGDVVAYLSRHETPSDIAFKAERLPSDLLRLQIQPIELQPLRPRFSGIANALTKGLRRRKPSYPDHALATDVQAVLAVHALRSGVAPMSLPKCKAVFITRNYDLYQMSREVFQQQQQAIPTCLPVSAFATMVWVREPLDAPRLPRERIVADAYAAMNPEDEEWEAVQDQTEKLRKAGQVSEIEAHRVRVHGESEHALGDVVPTADEPYLEGSAEQVSRRAEEWARLQYEARRDGLEEWARRLGRRSARALFAAFIPLACLGVIFGPLGVLGSPPSFISPFVQWVGTVFFGILSVASVVDGISLSRRVGWTAELFEHWAVWAVFRIFRYPPEAMPSRSGSSG